VGEVAEHLAIGGIGPVLVGGPARVADAMEAWVDTTGVDGFNLAFAVRPETMRGVVEHLVPELQRRGRYRTEYPAGTLRDKLFGPGHARLSPPHPAASFRFA
jgi:alkanesulfonate monooxygenase